MDSTINANLTFTFVDYDPKKGENFFAINRLDDLRASIVVKKDLLDEWGDYVLTVKVSNDFKKNFLDKSGAYIYAPSVTDNIYFNAKHFIIMNDTTIYMVSYSRCQIPAVPNDVCFLLGDSPACEVYMPTCRPTLSVSSSSAPMKVRQTACSETSTYKTQMPECQQEEAYNVIKVVVKQRMVSRT
jgi:hypothetical protein